MSGVKRYDPNYAVISPADDLAVEAADGMFVMSSDYDALAAECSRLSNELANTELRALKFIHQCNAHVELYQELEAERDELRAQVVAMRAAINAVMTMDVRGHQLQDRLQFSTRGRDILNKVNAALQANP